MNLTVEPKKQRVQDMQDGNFQLGLTRWGPDYADPMTYLGMWVTGNPTTTVCGAMPSMTPSSRSAPPATSAPTPRAAGQLCTMQKPSFWSRPSSSRCTASATPR